MNEPEKILGEHRRTIIINTLKAANKPIPGRTLGELTKVSRQVIVSDITLLKARNEPIMATSRGYVYLEKDSSSGKFEKTIVCSHTPQQTEEELTIFVDNGVTVKDVRIEHPVYGDLSACIMVSNRAEVRDFIEKVSEVNGIFLLNLSEGGIHIHTVTAESQLHIQRAEIELRKLGMLVE